MHQPDKTGLTKLRDGLILLAQRGTTVMRDYAKSPDLTADSELAIRRTNRSEMAPDAVSLIAPSAFSGLRAPETSASFHHAANARPLNASRVLQLQRQYGNHYVQRLLAQRANGETGTTATQPSVQRKCSCGGTCSKCSGAAHHAESEDSGHTNNSRRHDLDSAPLMRTPVPEGPRIQSH